jgi:hypothetical protein
MRILRRMLLSARRGSAVGWCRTDGGIPAMPKQGAQDAMAEKAIKTERGRKPKARNFYRTGPDLRVGGVPGYLIENVMALTGGRPVLVPPEGRRGFPEYPEAPLLVIDRKLGRPLRDLELCESYWLVSDRMKRVLESVDPAGVAFLRCTVRMADGTAAPTYWFCDVVRVLDAVDEAASTLRIHLDQRDDRKVYSFSGGASLVFREDVVGDAHIFRLAYLEPEVIGDQVLKDACKAAELKGITFKDAAKR